MTKALDNKKIGYRIKELRVKSGIAQTTLAKELGISQTHLSNIETGKVGLTTENLLKLAELLQCSLDDIIFGNIKSKSSLGKDLAVLNEFTLGDVLQALHLLKSVKAG